MVGIFAGVGWTVVQAELKRDKNDALLPQLCKIFHGEEIELDDLKDRNRLCCLPRINSTQA